METISTKQSKLRKSDIIDATDVVGMAFIANRFRGKHLALFPYVDDGDCRS